MGNQYEIVQYDNQLNTISFKKFHAIDYNFLMTLCARLRNMGTKEIQLSFQEIKQATGYSTKNTNERFVEELKRMNEKLLRVTFGYENDRMVQMFVLFTDFTIDKEDQTLTVSVNEKYAYLLNELTSQFTKFQLRSFNNLSSKYAKTLYRLLMQYRTTGFLRISRKDLFQALCPPKSYRTCHVIQRAIEPSLEEIKPLLPGLRMEVTRANDQGGTIEEFRFTFHRQPRSQIDRLIEPPRPTKEAEKSILRKQI